jgi:hypothetical protein
MKEFLRKIDSLSTVEELDVEYENYMSSFLWFWYNMEKP